MGPIISVPSDLQYFRVHFFSEKANNILNKILPMKITIFVPKMISATQAYEDKLARQIFESPRKRQKKDSYITQNQHNSASDNSIGCEILASCRWFELTKQERSKDPDHSKHFNSYCTGLVHELILLTSKNTRYITMQRQWKIHQR